MNYIYRATIMNDQNFLRGLCANCTYWLCDIPKYIKYATEGSKTGDLNKLYITGQHTRHLFKFKHNMSRGVILVAYPILHVLPTYSTSSTMVCALRLSWIRLSEYR